jgi:hypothetical protein
VDKITNFKKQEGKMAINKDEKKRIYNWILKRITPEERKAIEEIHPKVFIVKGNELGNDYTIRLKKLSEAFEKIESKNKATSFGGMIRS